MDNDTIRSTPNPVRRSRSRRVVTQEVSDISEYEDAQSRGRSSAKKDKSIPEKILSTFRSKPTKDPEGKPKPKSISSIRQDDPTMELPESVSHIKFSSDKTEITLNLNPPRPPPNETSIRALMAEIIEEGVASAIKDLPIERIIRKSMDKLAKTIQSKVENNFANRLDNLELSVNSLESRFNDIDGSLRHIGQRLDGIRRSMYGGWGRDPGPVDSAPMSPTGGDSSSRVPRSPSQGPGGWGDDYPAGRHGLDEWH